MGGYYCKECGREVIVRKGTVIRACEHKGTVVSEMKATAYSHGALKQGNGK